MLRDARVVRGAEARPKARRTRTARQEASRRGRIVGFSGPARRRFLWHVRNVEGLVFALTLTYAGPTPTDDAETKRHLAAFQRWSTRRRVGVVWKQEFTRHGRPHFHLATTAPLDVRAVRKAWARIAGCEETEALVEGRPIEDRTALEFYMVKRQGHPSNRVPEGYANMGKWWGSSGPGSSPVPLLTIQGGEGPVSPIVRAAKAMQRADRGRTRKGRDNGVTSHRLYGAGGKATARDLARYAETLGVGLLKSITGAGGKGFRTAEETAGDSE